jgi:hypothetical protein
LVPFDRNVQSPAPYRDQHAAGAKAAGVALIDLRDAHRIERQRFGEIALFLVHMLKAASKSAYLPATI